MDGVETGVLMSDFAQQFPRKNAEVPDIYLVSLDAAGISPTLVLKTKSQRQKETKLDPSQNMNVRICRDLTRTALLLMSLGAT